MSDTILEINRLRDDCLQFYQVIGFLAAQAGLIEDPQVAKALDNAFAAAEGEPRPHEDLLPFAANVKSPEALRLMADAIEGKS